MEGAFRLTLCKDGGHDMKKGFATGFVLLTTASVFGQAGRRQVAEGNKLFHEEKFDAAGNRYQDALLEDPASPLIHFNAGDAAYKKNDYEKALESFQKALDTDEALFQSQAYYNIGNTLYRAGKLPEAISAYEQALKLNQSDEDAKYNLEYVRNKLKNEAQPQQNDQQNQQQQQDQQQQQQQNKDDEQQNQQDKQKQDQRAREQEEQRNQEEQKQEQQGQDAEEKKEMTQEEAARLLEAMDEDQKDMKKQRMQGEGGTYVEKDW
jgi:tetratricopeptide (TPR) repeat protein